MFKVWQKIAGIVLVVMGFILTQVRGDAISITKEGVVGAMVILAGSALLFIAKDIFGMFTAEEEDD